MVVREFLRTEKKLRNVKESSRQKDSELTNLEKRNRDLELKIFRLEERLMQTQKEAEHNLASFKSENLTLHSNIKQFQQ